MIRFLPEHIQLVSGGYFPTIDSAFNKLSIDGIAGEVTLELTDALYTAPSLSSFILNGPIPGAGTSSRVTIQPADNVAVTIEGDGEAVLLFYDVSYLTLDGISLQGNTRLQVHALYNQLTPNWNDAIDFFGNSDYVQVQNLTTSSDDVTRYSAAIYFGTLGQEAPDSGLVSGVFVPIANSGIYLLGDGTYNPTGFVLSNNYIGSPTDSLIVWGIQNQMADGTIIENNKVENIRYGSPVNSIYYVHGINAYWSKNVIVRNNIVHNIAATVNNSRVQGIEISGSAGQSGVNNWVYNNMVYDIRSYASQNVGLSGIRAWDQDNLRIEYNSVSLSEVGDVAPGTGSAALWFESSNNSPSAYNNILVNTRNDSPYISTAIKFEGATGISDFNDLYVGLFDNSYIGQSGGTLYKSIADWQATGKDLNSISEMPNFVAPDLHIDININTPLDGHATPIVGIDEDFDGDLRNTSNPDIGADEFDVDPTATVWQMQNSNFPANVLVVHLSAVNNQVCWAVGQIYPGNTTPYVGYIRTTNGGNNWICDTIPGVTNSYLQQVFAIDADTAYITAYKLLGTSGSSRGIYKTTDGGTNWNRQEAYNSSQSGPGIMHFFDSQNGVVIGDPNLETYTTTNGGLTWNPVTMPTALSGEYTWIGNSRLIVSGDNVWFGTNRRLFKSDDKGYNWTILLNETQYYDWTPSIAFQNSQVGIYALKMGGTATDHIIRKTTEGGANWYTLSNSVLDNIAPSSIQYIPGTSSTYILTGGRAPTMRGTAVTFDAGESWTLIDTVGCYTINFSSDSVGWGSQFATNVVYKYVGPKLTTVEEEIIDLLPTGYMLSQNFPNPFNPSTTFRYSIPTQSKVVIRVFDILGDEIATLIDEEKSVGTYELTWNAANLPSGVYFYQLRAVDPSTSSGQGFVETKKMLLLK